MMTEAGDHYTLWQMFWYLGGFLLWGVAYAILVVRTTVTSRWVGR